MKNIVWWSFDLDIMNMMKTNDNLTVNELVIQSFNISLILHNLWVSVIFTLKGENLI